MSPSKFLKQVAYYNFDGNKSPSGSDITRSVSTNTDAPSFPITNDKVSLRAPSIFRDLFIETSNTLRLSSVGDVKNPVEALTFSSFAVNILISLTRP